MELSYQVSELASEIWNSTFQFIVLYKECRLKLKLLLHYYNDYHKIVQDNSKKGNIMSSMIYGSREWKSKILILWKGYGLK